MHWRLKETIQMLNQNKVEIKETVKWIKLCYKEEVPANIAIDKLNELIGKRKYLKECYRVESV